MQNGAEERTRRLLELRDALDEVELGAREGRPSWPRWLLVGVPALLLTLIVLSFAVGGVLPAVFALVGAVGIAALGLFSYRDLRRERRAAMRALDRIAELEARIAALEANEDGHDMDLEPEL